MVHFSAEIFEKELYELIQQESADFEVFCRYINELSMYPSKARLSILQDNQLGIALPQRCRRDHSHSDSCLKSFFRFLE